MTIGERLKDERVRLGMNQPDFAALAGRTKKTLIDYEKDATSPDAKFLAAIAAAGADVQYILTGVRAVGLGRASDRAAEDRGVYAVNPREAALIENYRECDEEGKRATESVALLGTRPQCAEQKRGR